MRWYSGWSRANQMPNAVLVGGTGLIGRAVARRLVDAGWTVTATGRNPANLPADLAADGVTFREVDRHDADALATLGGADLVVDCICYTAADARLLLPLARDTAGTVMISSRAVYVDAAGNHANSDDSPRYDGPVVEDHPTLAPSDMDYRSREGYGANKVAAERVLLDSGAPITILRPSKIHGIGAVKPNEWVFVKRILDRRPKVFLPHRGTSVDHTSASVNIAALVEVVAAKPAARILNSGDPDTLSILEICRAIARHLGWEWDEVLLDGAAEPAVGRLPWRAEYPMILDMSAAADLGYQPVGGYAATVAPMIDWLVSIARGRDSGDAQLPPEFDNEYFTPMCDYAAEDAYPA